MSSESDKKALANIEEFGCHVLKVMEGEGQPEFSYSIGIQKMTGQPEVLVLGLKTKLGHSMINNYNDRVKEGEKFETGKLYTDFLEGFEVCFVEVDKKHYEEYLGFGLWLYDGFDFKTYQIIWPTVDGIWPWDDNKTDFYQWAQPILNAQGRIVKI